MCKRSILDRAMGSEQRPPPHSLMFGNSAEIREASHLEDRGGFDLPQSSGAALKRSVFTATLQASALHTPSPDLSGSAASCPPRAGLSVLQPS